MSDYSEKLKDPRWQQKRLRIMERDNFTCRLCGATDKPLHVHHCGYDKGVNPWDYEDERLLTLCERSHRNVETILRETALGVSDNEFNFALAYLVILRKAGLAFLARKILFVLVNHLVNYERTKDIKSFVKKLDGVFELPEN